jgi:hypothetical protein
MAGPSGDPRPAKAPPSNDGEGVVGEARRVVDPAMDKIAEQGAFSSKAFSRLKTETTDFVVEFVRTSAQNARRDQSDMITERHVAEAIRYLYASRPRRIRALLSLAGGVLLGAGASGLLSLVSMHPVELPSVFLTVILLMIGLGLIKSDW